MKNYNILPPNLFLIGAPKCGTTALAEQLGAHPGIFLGKKEPRYFDARTFYDFMDDWPVKSIDEYLNYYNSDVALKSVYRLDASVFNMYSKESIADILRLSPDAKFIVVLRDPLSASKSMHLQRLKYVDKKMREVSEDFEICWSMLSERQNGKGYPSGCRNRILFRYDLLYSYHLYIPFLTSMIDDNSIIFIDYAAYRKNLISIHTAILDFLSLPIIDLPATTANPSNIVKLTRKNRLFYTLLRILKKSPCKFSLSNTSISKFITKFISLNTEPAKVSDAAIDHEIRLFFKESYDAMNSVLSRYNFNLHS